MRWKSMSVIIAGALMVAMLAACGEDATPAPTQAPSTVAPAPTQAPSTDTTPDDTMTQPDDTMTQPDDSMTMAKEEPVLGGIWDYERGTPDLHDPYFLRGGPSDLNIFNSLIQMRFPFNPAEGIQFEPYLATEWTVSEDGSKWRFKLREGVVWHDNEVFDADDVIATTERLLDQDFIVQPLQVTIRKVLDSVTKIGDYEVEFDTGSADATALSYFRSHYFLFVPEHLITGTDPSSTDVEERWTRLGTQEGQSGTYATGTGPFYVKDWELDVEMNMLRNENYFRFDDEGRKVPYLDQVRYHDIPDPIRRMAFFVAGKSEYSQGPAAGMTLRDSNALCRQSKDDDCRILKWPHGFGTMTNNNVSTPVFNDSKVNAAHRYAHNVEYVVNTAFAGGSPWLWVEREYWPDSTLTVQEQYEVMPWSNPAQEQEYENRAHELLSDAGYADGVDLPYPFFGAGTSSALCYGSFLDQYSRHMDEIYNAGFKTILECRSGVVYDDEMLAGRWSIWGYYPATSLIDPSTGIIQAAVKDSRIMVYLKNGGWIWDELDTLDSRYRVIQKTVDPAQQKELLKDFERYMVAPEQPHFVTYYARVYMSVRECVHNYWPAGIWHSHQWSLEQVWITGDCQSGN
jgi:ABC-type transport system substrate-binding protein